MGKAMAQWPGGGGRCVPSAPHRQGVLRLRANTGHDFVGMVKPCPGVCWVVFKVTYDTQYRIIQEHVDNLTRRSHPFPHAARASSVRQFRLWGLHSLSARLWVFDC